MIPSCHALRCVPGAPSCGPSNAKAMSWPFSPTTGLALFCRPECHAQEELSLRVLLAASSPARRIASWGRGMHQSTARPTLARSSPSTWISTRCPTTATIPWCRSPLSCPRAAAASPACWPSWRRMPTGHAFCYSNADLRKGEEARGDLPLHRVSGNGRTASLPRHLVFDSSLTTYAHLARLDRWASPS